MDGSSQNSSKNIALASGGLCTVTARILGSHLREAAGDLKDGNAPNEREEVQGIPL